MYKLHTCVKEFSPLSSSSLGRRRRRRRKTSFLFPGGDRRKEKNLKKGGWKKAAVVVVPYANEKRASSCSNCCPPNKNMSLTRKIGHFMGETEIIVGSELGRDLFCHHDPPPAQLSMQFFMKGNSFCSASFPLFRLPCTIALAEY